MEQVNEQAAQPRRSIDQVALLLKLLESYTGTTKDFCKEHNISEGAFYAARKRYSIKTKEVEQQGSGFTALTQPAFKVAHASLFASVGEIKIYQAVTPGYRNRQCSQPTEQVKAMYTALHYKHQPFTRKKSVVPPPEFKKTQTPETIEFLSG